MAARHVPFPPAEVPVGKATMVVLAMAALALLAPGDWLARLGRGDAVARFLGYEVHVSVTLDRANRVATRRPAFCGIRPARADSLVTSVPPATLPPDTLWVRSVLR
jgi:hypothetical protein